jgi:hypothetical protein
MKIAIAFFGLPRCSEKAFPSIEKQIMANLPPDAEVKCFYHFYLQHQVVNPRSKECGDLDESNYAPFKKFQGIFEKPEEVILTLPLGELKKFGDAWKDNFNSTKNLLLQLHSIKKVTELLEEFDPDCVLYARPDLVYHDPIETKYYWACFKNKNSAFIPEWQWGIGVNDRFAIVGKDAYQSYGKRIDEVIKYCADGQRPLHAERLLKDTLLKNKVDIYIMKTKASRIRINGDYAPEKFLTNISLFSPISNRHKRFLFLAQMKTKRLLLSLVVI